MTKRNRPTNWQDTEFGRWWVNQTDRVRQIIEHDPDPRRVRIAMRQREALTRVAGKLDAMQRRVY